MTDALDEGAGAAPEADDASATASVVHIDRHEDIATVCGKLDTAPSYAVVIHAPSGNRSLSREIGMRRLLRHADETGKLIAFATTSRALASRARSLRIPVARKPHHVRWDAGGRVILRVPGHSFAIPALGRAFQVLFILGFAAALVAAVVAMGPSARVRVYPPTERLLETVTITASTDITEIDAENLRVPAELVTATRRVTIAIPTTGSVMVGSEPAHVTVTLTNSGPADITIPAGTAFLDDSGDIAFTLDTDTTLVPGQTFAVAATAVDPGAAGNIGPNTLTRIAGGEFPLVRVTNAGNAGGGADAPARAIDSRDLTTLRETAEDLESAAVIRDFIVQDRPGDAVFVESASADVTLGSPSGAAGTVAEVVTMDVEVTVSALAVVAGVLESLAKQVLAPDNGSGRFISGSVRAVETENGEVGATESTVTAEFTLSGEFAEGVTEEDIKDAVKGRSEEGARSTLLGQYGMQKADVDLTPGWAPWLPRFGFRIDVEFTTLDESTTESEAEATPGG